MAVTRTDVAKKAGVSGTTVSFVMTGVWKKHGISAATYEKVKAAAKELGYVPNPAAIELRGGKTGRIGVMLWYVNRPFYSSLTDSFYRHAAKANSNLMLFIRNFEKPFEPFIKNAIAQTDALIVLDEFLPDMNYQGLLTGQKKLVFIHPWQIRNTPTILNDMGGRVYLAAKHLIEQGYSHLYFNSVNPLRTRGFKKALELADLPFDDSMLVGAGAFDYSHGKELAESVEIKPDGKTGIIAANDYVAMSCMHHLNQRGFSAGKDYGIVGFDNFSADPYLPVPLTSVYRSAEALAESTFSAIHGDASITEPIVVPNAIEIRQSTAPTPAAGKISLPDLQGTFANEPSDKEKSLLAEGGLNMLR